MNQSRVRVALIAAAGSLVAGCFGQPGATPSPTSDTAPTTVRVATQAECVCQLALYIAKDQGFFRAHGIDVQMLKEPTPLTGLLTGAADISFAAPTQALLAKTRGQDVRILYTSQKRLTQALIVGPGLNVSPSANWQTAAQALKGHTVGITSRGGSIDVDLRFILVKAGLNPDNDVSLVPLGTGTALVAGFASKKVDAVFSYQPPTTLILQQHLGTVVIDLGKGQGPSELDQPMTVAIIQGKLATDSPKLVEKIVAALTDASKFMIQASNRDKVLTIAATNLAGLDPTTLGALVTEEISLQDPRYTKNQHANVEAVLTQLGILKSAVPYDQLAVPQLQKNWP